MLGLSNLPDCHCAMMICFFDTNSFREVRLGGRCYISDQSVMKPERIETQNSTLQRTMTTQEMMRHPFQPTTGSCLILSLDFVCVLFNPMVRNKKTCVRDTKNSVRKSPLGQLVGLENQIFPRIIFHFDVTRQIELPNCSNTILCGANAEQKKSKLDRPNGPYNLSCSYLHTSVYLLHTSCYSSFMLHVLFRMILSTHLFLPSTSSSQISIFGSNQSKKIK